MISQEKKDQFNQLTHSGEIYASMDDEFIVYQHTLVQKILDFNNTAETPAGLQTREHLLHDMVGTYGKNLYVIPPIYANSGLNNVHFGQNVVINFNCNFVDDGDIYIGDDCMVGPGVTFATALHPISPKLRRHKLQFNHPIRLGQNVWIGANATILPGVIIGDNAVVGAGSVVTKDVAANTIVVGNPARKLRDITPGDDVFYEKDKRVPQAIRERYL
ncbi:MULTISPECIES: sugar O-acetyltransferase [Lactobacillaceae]|uniref:sugar O-acetyltransferase n=1 Tax=Lactobacillaceae TaxID=33958 RepID=UPI0014574B85|nr:sugar O-acetyltransferase [Lactobacillus sp. HBUAS51381]NLR09153.1 sugar O-acetyltransferase [Lactobacillus sp. HBUAS51381]